MTDDEVRAAAEKSSSYAELGRRLGCSRSWARDRATRLGIFLAGAESNPQRSARLGPLREHEGEAELQRRLARRAGLSWSEWARRHLERHAKTEIAALSEEEVQRLYDD